MIVKTLVLILVFTISAPLLSSDTISHPTCAIYLPINYGDKDWAKIPVYLRGKGYNPIIQHGDRNYQPFPEGSLVANQSYEFWHGMKKFCTFTLKVFKVESTSSRQLEVLDIQSFTQSTWGPQPECGRAHIKVVSRLPICLIK